jgi:hypothetical protein
MVTVAIFSPLGEISLPALATTRPGVGPTTPPSLRVYSRARSGAVAEEVSSNLHFLVLVR